MEETLTWILLAQWIIIFLLVCVIAFLIEKINQTNALLERGFEALLSTIDGLPYR